MTVLEVDMTVLKHFRHRSEIDLVCPRDVSELRAKPIPNNFNCGLIVLKNEKINCTSEEKVQKL